MGSFFPPQGTGGGGTPDDDSVSTAKIQDGAVTFAKMASLADQRLLGNVSGSAAAPAALTAAQVTSLLNIAAGRDVFRRFLFASKSPINAATFTAYGFTAPTFTGTAVRVADADGDWVRCVNSGAGGGLVNKSDCLIETRHHPVFTIRVKTGPALPVANERIFVGLSSGDPMGADDPGAVHCLLFRYAPQVDGTAFWRVVTNDAGVAENVVVTAVAIAVDTVYEMKIDATDPASILFYINGTLAATVATDLPTTSQALNITSAVKDSVGDKQWFNSNYTVEMD